MDLKDGFQVNRPDVQVPWRTSPSEFLELIGADEPELGGVRQITNAYFTVTGEALGIETTIGFHFKREKLDQIELFDANQKELKAGFEKYQTALVREFGEPTRSIVVGGEFPAHEWKLGASRILHFVQERFGTESHLRILAPGSSFSYDPFGR